MTDLQPLIKNVTDQQALVKKFANSITKEEELIHFSIEKSKRKEKNFINESISANYSIKKSLTSKFESIDLSEDDHSM